MERSGGVTASAVLVFIGSGFTVLFAAFSALAFFAVRDVPSQPSFVRYVIVGVAVFEVGFAIWGIFSGIGLLRLREWARISLLIFSGILLFFTLPVLLIVPLMPFPAPEGMPANSALFMKLFLVIFYAIPAALGGWWLYFFNKRSVKDQFGSGATSAIEVTGGPARPLSITIIGWLMVVIGGFGLPFSFLRFPALFFGFMLVGWQTLAFSFMRCVVYIVAGAGLLKLKRWAWILAICVLSFGVLNALGSALMPGRQGRFERAMSLVQSRMGLPQTPMPVPVNFLLWFGLVFGLLSVGVQLWFVVTRKKAFFAAQESPAQPAGT